jgi:predicted  nucleic acid-binding Zn-ribbon protein
MESLTSGTIAGAGSFRCQRCGYVLTLAASDTLTDCPGCGGAKFVRASLFSAANTPAHESAGTGVMPQTPARQEWLASVREGLGSSGQFIVYEEEGRTLTVALAREWTRIGRSLAADVRFDDPTVSRRHALIVRHPDGVRVLDDRSLNGVFVNGQRVEWRTLQDGDEILVGRYLLTFVDVAAPGERAPGEREDPGAAPLHMIG